MTHPQSIHRRDGVTTAERYLKWLCDSSFLSLWSYAGIHRDQFDSPTAKVGKELCDLLVVFQDHILLFSDKDCAYPDGKDEELNWRRWFKRAVQDSAKQLWGAERWIKTNPQRIFLDSACTQRFPIPLPDPATAIFHRLIVAHGASAQCKTFFGGGSGSLMMDSTVIGPLHTRSMAESGKPFTLGQIDPAKGYIHVFDDTSLTIIMSTLDTVTDFVLYLAKKEQFMTSDRAISVAGEEELLAYYLRNRNSDGEHDFVWPADIKGLCITEGLWEEFISSPEYQAQQKADRISYVWDGLIEQFNMHIIHGTQYYTMPSGVEYSERSVRFLAREPRTRRRFLAQSLLDMLETASSRLRSTRVVEPSRPGDPYYVFLLFPHLQGVSYDTYREDRRLFLTACLVITKLLYPQALDIVGIATEASSLSDRHRSEDVLYLDARDWTEEQQATARGLQEDLGLLTHLTKSSSVVQEYPCVPLKFQQGPNPRFLAQMKGRDRNKPCFCGSGKKFKKCCG